jgi:ribokinase
MDFLAIGDTVVDTFIKLKDAEVHCDINNEHCTISMRFGDKIPFESATVVPAVGNAANAAVAASRLELSSALISWLGKDRDGGDCLASLKKDGVDTSFVTVEEGKQTNSHYVLWYGAERTILIKHEAFDCALPSTIPAPKAVYLSSLSEHALPLHDDIAAWLGKSPKVVLAFQPGTFQIKAGFTRLESIYKRTDIFFANKEEYQRILGSAEEDPKKLMQVMRDKGPKTCVLTNGPEGAYAFDGAQVLKIPEYPDPKPPFERTGAGDAFASTVVAALVLGKTLPEALAWGPVNAMSVVQYIGAQRGLLARPALESYLKMAPAGYRATPL